MTTNSLGMALVEVPAGRFEMGQAEISRAGGDRCGGDDDERPVHEVEVSAFLLAATPVTNAQYEAFLSEHARLRGRCELSTEGDEAVVYVTWHEAVRFCQWLSEKEGLPYRLPTEAEWEYACRAGTTTQFNTGEELPEEHHRHQKSDWHPTAVSLRVGQSPPNGFGLCDMHGLVEEWCHDWYGPYGEAAQRDPVGPADGLFRVTRGGSHNTDVEFLRSANRLGTVPEDRHWLIGFRVVQGELPATQPTPAPRPPAAMREVKQEFWTWAEPPGDPLFAEPIPFVREPEEGSGTPFHPHNHCPSITWCPNGDLLAVWFSTVSEAGREMTILGSRLRAGKSEWDRASEVLKAPDRNMTGSALFHDGSGTIYHTNGLEAGSHWANLALVVRTSRDNGAKWTRPLLANAEHQPRNQVISGTSMTRDGWLIQPCDAVYGGSGGTAIHLSRDGGRTWVDPGAGTDKPDFQGDEPGGTIAGIHAGVVCLRDGRLLALGRGDSRLGDDMNIGERMPQSLSEDMGRSWRYCASPFPPIGGGQRLVLARLRQGPLLLVSFTDSSQLEEPVGMSFADAAGAEVTGYGMFAALSYDEGATWPARKLLTDGQARELDGGAWTQSFAVDATHAEPRGYLAMTQTPDEVIHLISSRLHYRFDLSWLEGEQTQERR